MSLNDLPIEIKNFIVNKMTSEYIPADNELHCTELLGCTRKVYLRRKRTTKPEMKVNQAFYFYRGDLFDKEWTSLFKRHQVSVMHRVPNSPFLIRGRVDFLDDNGLLWEMKTIKNLYYLNQPKPDHLKQVKFYCYCLCKNRAKLMYIDFGDARVFDISFSDEELNQNLKEFEDKARIIYNSIMIGIPPDPDPSYSIYKNGKINDWECQYCDMREECKIIGGTFPWEKSSDSLSNNNTSAEEEDIKNKNGDDVTIF